jgi:hypothetical protein
MTKNTQMVCYDKAKHVGLGRPTDVARTPFFYLKKKINILIFYLKKYIAVSRNRTHNLKHLSAYL